GQLTIETRPANLEILLDGKHGGMTPLTLTVVPGLHSVTIRNGSEERVVPVTIAAGADITQYFEMKPIEPVVETGHLTIVTDPPGARVSVDGVPRGTSPVTVDDLRAGEHRVSVPTDGGHVERTVSVASASTVSVVFSLPKASGPVGGWLAV